MFVTFEGIDGSGKSTQVDLLSQYLTSINVDHVCTKEPAGTDIGISIKEILSGIGKGKLSSLAQYFLFLADREHHINTVIKPALEAGKIVLCDRYADSTIAYQVMMSSLPVDGLLKAMNLVVGSFIPDVTFLLSVPVKEAISNVKNDSYIHSKESMLEKVVENYKILASNNSSRYRVIPRNTINRTHLLILRAFNDALNFKKGVRLEDTEGKFKPLVQGRESKPLNNVKLPEGYHL